MGLSIHITTTTAAEPVVDHYKNIKKTYVHIVCISVTFWDAERYIDR